MIEIQRKRFGTLCSIFREISWDCYSTSPAFEKGAACPVVGTSWCKFWCPHSLTKLITCWLAWKICHIYCHLSDSIVSCGKVTRDYSGYSWKSSLCTSFHPMPSITTYFCTYLNSATKGNKQRALLSQCHYRSMGLCPMWPMTYWTYGGKADSRPTNPDCLRLVRSISTKRLLFMVCWTYQYPPFLKGWRAKNCKNLMKGPNCVFHVPVTIWKTYCFFHVQGLPKDSGVKSPREGNDIDIMSNENKMYLLSLWYVICLWYDICHMYVLSQQEIQ